MQEETTAISLKAVELEYPPPILFLGHLAEQHPYHLYLAVGSNGSIKKGSRGSANGDMTLSAID